MKDDVTLGPVSPLRPERAARSLVRHGAGFLTSGIIALAVDTGITSALTRALGVPPLVARPIAIAVAIVVAWACHRTLTFAVTAAPTFAEFLRYAAVAATAATINYMIFAAIVVLSPSTAPEAALVASSIASMIVSYAGMRVGVFKQPSPHPHDAVMATKVATQARK